MRLTGWGLGLLGLLRESEWVWLLVAVSVGDAEFLEVTLSEMPKREFPKQGLTEIDSGFSKRDLADVDRTCLCDDKSEWFVRLAMTVIVGAGGSQNNRILQNGSSQESMAEIACR